MAYKVSLKILADKAIDKFLNRSIEKDMINNEKELIVISVRDVIVGKKVGDTISFPDGYEK